MTTMTLAGRRLVPALPLALIFGLSGCGGGNGGTFPAGPPPESRAKLSRNSFDNPPLGDPLSPAAADLKGYAAGRPTRGRR